MFQYQRDALELFLGTQRSPQFDVYLHREDGQSDNSIVTVLFHSPLSSKKIEFDIDVDDVNKYPNDHQFHFRLRSPSPHSKEDEDLLQTLSQLGTRGKNIKEVIRSVGLNLVMQARYGAESFEVPDDKTKLVAVLGPNDFVEYDWMVADFCLLYRALGGTANRETWLTANSLPSHVLEHGPILHGSPYRKPRRVVFDHDFHDFTSLVPAMSLAQSFLASLRTAAQDAVSGDRIIVIIVAHGKDTNGNVEIGNDSISRSVLESTFAGVDGDVNITILTTACHSGIWAVPFTNPRVTTIAATTSDKPSLAIPASDSGYARGGLFADALVTEFSQLLQDRSDASDIVEPQRLGNVLTKTVSVSDLTSKTVLSDPYGLFSSYAQRVIKSVKSRQHGTPATTWHSPETATKQTAEVLGGNNELSTLFRIGAVLELPKEANFSCIALAAGSSSTPQKTAGRPHRGYWARRAHQLYQQLALRSPGLDNRSDNLNVSRFSKRVADGVLPEEKCEQLARRIDLRFQTDDKAQAVVSAMISSLGFMGHIPHITDWDWDMHDTTITDEYRAAIAAFQSLDTTYYKPRAFIKWVANQCSPSVELLQKVIQDTLMVAHGAGREDGGIPQSCSLKSLSSLENVFNKHHLESLSPPGSLSTTSLDLRVDGGQVPV